MKPTLISRLLAALVLVLVLAPMARAAEGAVTVTPTGSTAIDARKLAIAMAGATSGITDASFVTLPPSGTPNGVADGSLAGFPLVGTSFAILTTGDATAAPNADQANQSSSNDGGGARDTTTPGNERDTTTLKVDLNVPSTDNCLSFGIRFLSEEFPDFVGGTVNDSFIAELDTSDWTAASDGTITAPHNFAFDDASKPLTVNTAGFNTDAGVGTVYNGGTDIVRPTTPITPGAHSLYLSIFDQGDNILDTAAFLDDLRLDHRPAGACATGFVDKTPPAVTVDHTASPFGTATPALSGDAGTAPGDQSSVKVELYRGASATGSPIQARTVTPASGKWSFTPTALADGTYTVKATQVDDVGNVGTSSYTFAVRATTAPFVTILTPADGSHSTDPGPKVTGHASPGSVDWGLYRGTSTSGSTTLSGQAPVTNGTWAFFFPRLGFGTYTLTASEAGPGGLVGHATPVTFTIVPAKPANLRVTVTQSDPPILVGRDLTFTVTVTNLGPGTATGVDLTDQLPDDATLPDHEAGSLLRAALPKCSRAGRKMSCGVGSLHKGQSASYKFVVVPKRATDMTNTAAAAGDQVDPATASNSSRARTTAVHVPKLTKTIDAAVVKGTVRYRKRGQKRFKTLKDQVELPVGSLVDATKGRVRITSERDAKGHVQSADFYSGEFLLKQRRANQGQTTLLLRGSNFAGCPAPSRQANAAAVGRKKKRKRRSLWGSGKGSFRTGGRYGSATVRGTIWFTQDNCRSTFFKTARGVVSVRDYVKGKTVAVPKGHSYTARAPKK